MRGPFPRPLHAALLAFAATALAASCSVPVDHEASALAKPSFDPTLVAKGAGLAAIGNCATCHTAHRGKAYAGGLPLATPFGTVYGTNITPDPETGIGRWTERQFARAMREGVGLDGRHLYPAFPYDYFTRLADDDIRALYAFLMTREPVEATPPANRMIVPRFAVAFWKARYFKRGAFQADPKQGAQWNRGAYLVEALAHCSACHTPRNALGAEKKEEYMSGGEAGGWHAPALNASSPSPVPWNADSMGMYLRTGLVEAHAVTAGPMEPVVRNLSGVPPEETRSIALYVASLDERSREQRERQSRDARAAPPSSEPRLAGSAIAKGAVLYAGACGDCHDRGRQAEGGALPLPLATGLTMPTPRNLIRVIRDGIVPAEHRSQPWMPEFAGALTDDQLADLVTYLRSLTGKPQWQDVTGEVRRIARGDE
jgi:mono/diheme cytochrome c family protein